MPRDPDSLKGARLGRGTARRVWQFARPYRGTIALFLAAILIAALLALVPPLVTRAILDTAIPDGNRQLIVWLAAAAVGAALCDAALQIVQRWCSARVGEGLIADLRRALFAKVQRLPIAFFTRTPTGAITSRLNNDVIGAQTAVTSTLGSVVSNVVVLVTSLVAMLALEWRLTLMALAVLPMFVIPARRVGRRLQDISREQMQHNAAMNTQMTERFNVSGAMLVKLFGDLDRENAMFGRRATAVRDAGIRSAMLGRVFFVALGLVAALGAAAIYGVGAMYVVDGDITTGHTRRPRRARRARLPTAHRTDQREGRPDDVDGELRAGVRRARCAGGDPGAAGRRRPGRSEGAGRVRRRRVPLPTRVRIVDHVARAADDPRRRSRSRRPPGRVADGRAGRDTGARRRFGSREEHARLARASPVRRHQRCRSDRRARRPRPHPGDLAAGDRCRVTGPAPVPRVDR